MTQHKHDSGWSCITSWAQQPLVNNEHLASLHAALKTKFAFEQPCGGEQIAALDLRQGGKVAALTGSTWSAACCPGGRAWCPRTA